MVGNVSINVTNTTFGSSESVPHSFVVVNLVCVFTAAVLVVVEGFTNVILHRCKTLPYQVRYLSTSFLSAEAMSSLIFIGHQIAIFVFGYNADIFFNSRTVFVGTGLSISWASMALISFERVLALKFSLTYENILSKKSWILTIALTWFFHLLTPSVLFVLFNFVLCTWDFSKCNASDSSKVTRLFLLAIMLIYETAVFVSCITISRIVTKHVRNILAQLQQTRASANVGVSPHSQLPASITVMKVAVVFFVLHLPLLAHLTLFELSPEKRDSDLRRLFHTIAYLCIQVNSAASVFMYILKFQECKLKFYELCCSCAKSVRKKTEEMRITVYNIALPATSSSSR